MNFNTLIQSLFCLLPRRDARDGFILLESALISIRAEDFVKKKIRSIVFFFKIKMSVYCSFSFFLVDHRVAVFRALSGALEEGAL